jgi:hypothetical protein
MSVIIREHRNREAGTWGTERTLLAGVVLSHARATRHVPSDRAWLDSGNVISVRYWDADRGRPAYSDFGTDDCDLVVTDDASPEMRRLADAYGRVQTFLIAVRDYVRDRSNVRPGVSVEVYKGRKVPKGVYEVAATGAGQYGPYLHLRDAAGVWHRYISADNVKPVIDLSGVEKLVAKHLPAKYAPLVAGIMASARTFGTRNMSNIVEFDRHGWAVLADALEEDGHEWAGFVREEGPRA